MSKWFEDVKLKTDYNYVSSRVRLVRNLDSFVFPDRLSQADSQVLLDGMLTQLSDINEYYEKELNVVHLNTMSDIEKQTLKDDVIATLLPRAFSKYQQTAIWIDVENNLIYVDAASAKRAEEVLALLRKSLGSLPVVPLTFANDPALIMQNWIAQENTPEWLVPLEEAELRDSQTNGVIRCKQQALDSEEILSLVHSKFVTKLALEWEERLSFVLNEDCSLKRLKFADQIREKNDDILKEDYAQRFDADFVLMTGILSQLTENLLHDFGGEKERL